MSDKDNIPQWVREAFAVLIREWDMKSPITIMSGGKTYTLSINGKIVPIKPDHDPLRTEQED